MNIPVNTYAICQSGFSSTGASDSNTVNIHSSGENNLTYPTASGNTRQEPIARTSAKQEGKGPGSEKNGSNPHTETTPPGGLELNQAQIRLLEELKQTDIKIRRHETAHIAAGGKYILSGANLTYTRGPDGKNYAVAGEVRIDTSPVPGDPQATIRKMRQIKTAALAPAAPSPQDLKVASNATSAEAKALSELMTLQANDQTEANENKAFGNLKKAAAHSYKRTSHLLDDNRQTFRTTA